MKYSILLFDIDDTLLDFSGCQYKSLEQALASNGLTLNLEMFETFKLINRELWQNFEEGIYTKNEILTLRFDLLFVQNGTFGDAAQISHDYLIAMGDHIQYEEGARQLLNDIKGKAIMVAVTNGAKLAQDGKLTKTGLDTYFDYTFISDDTGYHKPQKEYFDIVANEVDGFDLKKVLLIGDGIGSDILGGNNYGIDTCWYNKFGQMAPDHIKPTYEVNKLKEILEIL